MTVIFHDDGVISQFEGYNNLKELDWEAYRQKYGNIQRLDRILKAENDSPDNYKVSKQPDATMLFYLLTHEELLQTLKKMGYPFNRDLIFKTIRYYQQRTSHGSTLSLSIFAGILFPFDREESWKIYKRFALSDLCDIQCGTTAEGIHVASMACSINMLLYQVSGIGMTTSALLFNPVFPKELKRLAFRIQFKSQWIDVELTQNQIIACLDKVSEVEVTVSVRGHSHSLVPGSCFKFELNAF